MNKSIIKKLETKTKEDLLEIIVQLGKFKGVTEFVKLHYLSEPNKAVNELKKVFDRYKRKTTKFYEYHATIEFFNELVEKVISPIETKLIKNVPLESANLVQYIIDNFESLVENKDDSSGCAMEFLYTCVDLWGKAWQHVKDKDIEQLAKLVNKYYRNHQYIDSEIFESFKAALGKDGLLYLEEYLSNNIENLLYIVELQNDPDKYRKILEQSNSSSNIKHVLVLSAMLIDKFRIPEAIDLLEKISKSNMTPDDYIKHGKLLIKAYEDDGRVKEAQNIRWQLFVHTLRPDFYTEFIKYVNSEEERDKYKQQAINYALNAKEFNDTLLFMEAIQEYVELEDLIINNLDRLSEYNYSYYRKLSKSLASNGRYLSATLLRRYLADNVLLNARSKYYDYAISDLKQAIEFGDKIENWKSFLDTKHYFSQLIEKHKKKYSFLEKLHPLLRLIK